LSVDSKAACKVISLNLLHVRLSINRKDNQAFGRSSETFWRETLKHGEWRRHCFLLFYRGAKLPFIKQEHWQFSGDFKQISARHSTPKTRII